MRRLKIILLAVVLPLAVIGGCGMMVAKRMRPKKDPPKTAKVERGDVVVAVRETGTVEPIKRVEVKSKVAGALVLLAVEEGDRVEKGQLIARLDAPEVEAQRDQARAQLDAARARLEQARLSYVRDRELVESQVKQAEANLRVARSGVRECEARRDEAKRVYASKQRLFEMGGYVSQNEVDSAKSAVEVAFQGQCSAEERVKEQEIAVGMAEARRSEVAMSRSRVDESEASLRQLHDSLTEIESRLKDAVIAAPCAGTIISRQVREGELMTAVSYYGSGAPIVVIGDLSTMLVKVDLNEVDVDKVRLGQEVKITADALRDRKFAGRVTRIAPASVSNPQQGDQGIVRFPVEITVTGDSADLKTGMTANVEISCQSAKGVLWVPNDAVFEKKGKWYVSVVAEVKAAKGKPPTKPEKKDREVVKGLANDARTEVRSGVKQGEKVELGKSGMPDRKKIDMGGPHGEEQ
jgi:RND family efflux transporter MFP subunit